MDDSELTKKILDLSYEEKLRMEDAIFYRGLYIENTIQLELRLYDILMNFFGKNINVKRVLYQFMLPHPSFSTQFKMETTQEILRIIHKEDDTTKSFFKLMFEIITVRNIIAHHSLSDPIQDGFSFAKPSSTMAGNPTQKGGINQPPKWESRFITLKITTDQTNEINIQFKMCFAFLDYVYDCISFVSNNKIKPELDLSKYSTTANIKYVASGGVFAIKFKEKGLP